MRKFTALVLASSLAMGAVNLAHAADATTPTTGGEKPMMDHKGPRGPHHGMMMFNNLNLTAEQKQQIGEIMKSQRDKMQPPTQEQRREMHNLVASDSFDKAKAEAMIDKGMADNKTKMLSHMEAQNKIYNLLTAEQKKQYNANFEKHLTDGPMKHGKMKHSQMQ